eukprot:2953219-Rhodomonas_salina.2
MPPANVPSSLLLGATRPWNHLVEWRACRLGRQQGAFIRGSAYPDSRSSGQSFRATPTTV